MLPGAALGLHSQVLPKVEPQAADDSKATLSDQPGTESTRGKARRPQLSQCLLLRAVGQSNTLHRMREAKSRLAGAPPRMNLD